MLSYVAVSLAALLVAALTLFSGFGLGTLLMPVFALFFPVPVAIAATAVVHLANNLFKVGLVGRQANGGVVLRFALPAAVAAMVGAALLNWFAAFPPVLTYQLGTQQHTVTAVNAVVGLLIILFACFDLLPRYNQLTFSPRYLSLGGAISGFFGGLSGNQGALRSAFLIKLGLDKEGFIGSSVVSAVVVDVARLLVYGFSFYTTSFEQLNGAVGPLIIVASLAAFLGSFMGARLLKKVTLRMVQQIVGVMLILLGAALAVGLI